MTLTTKIGGFTVSLEPNEDREGFQCWISRGDYCASLALANDYGSLDPDDQNAPRVSTRVLDQVEAWAVANGY
jgi:hypothetical protein